MLLAVACLGKDHRSSTVVIADKRAIEAEVIVQILEAREAHALVEGEAIALWLLGDDVDDPSDGRRTEEGRASTTYDFDTLDHIGWDLLQSIDTSQCAHDWTAVDEDLRVATIETIDTNLVEATVLTVIFDTYTWLEDQPLSEVGRVGILEELRVEYGDECRCQTAEGSLTIGGDNDLIDIDVVGFNLEVYFDDLVRSNFDDALLAQVSKATHDERHALLLEVFEEVMTCSIGSCAEGRPLNRDGDPSEVFPRLRVGDVANDIGIGQLSLCCKLTAEPQSRS